MATMKTHLHTHYYVCPDTDVVRMARDHVVAQEQQVVDIQEERHTFLIEGTHPPPLLIPPSFCGQWMWQPFFPDFFLSFPSPCLAGSMGTAPDLRHFGFRSDSFYH